jgi:hypothetical protein
MSRLCAMEVKSTRSTGEASCKRGKQYHKVMFQVPVSDDESIPRKSSRCKGVFQQAALLVKNRR